MPEERLEVTCSRGVKVVADKAITDCAGEEWDLIVCPGGLPGADHLRDCPTLTAMLKKQVRSGGWLCGVVDGVWMDVGGAGPLSASHTTPFVATLPSEGRGRQALRRHLRGAGARPADARPPGGQACDLLPRGPLHGYDVCVGVVFVGGGV